MKFFLILFVLILTPAYASHSITLSDSAGDYVQIFTNDRDEKYLKVVEAFTKAGYFNQDPMVKNKVIHERTWCTIQISENKKVTASPVENITIKCQRPKSNGILDILDFAIINNDYSVVPIAAEHLRRKIHS